MTDTAPACLVAGAVPASRLLLAATAGWAPGAILAEVARWARTGWSTATLLGVDAGAARGACRWWAREAGRFEHVDDPVTAVDRADTALLFAQTQDATTGQVIARAVELGVPLVIHGRAVDLQRVRWRPAGTR